MALYFFYTVKAHRSVHLLPLLSFLILSPALLPCIIGLARGRPLLELSEVAREGDESGKGTALEGSMMMIGSRPPRCQGICRACGRCEAVQVPAMPQRRNGAGKQQFSAAINTRVDDSSSNYKPLSWKCKCGDVILNP